MDWMKVHFRCKYNLIYLFFFSEVKSTLKLVFQTARTKYWTIYYARDISALLRDTRNKLQKYEKLLFYW